MNFTSTEHTSSTQYNSTKDLTLTIITNNTWRIPLEDSVNVTELSSYIFSTPLTQEHVSIFSSSTQSHLTPTDVTNRTTLSQPRTSYDSKGAAYYICSVILVYALAIVLLVISLARRKRKDQYQPANQRSNGDDYYVKGGQGLAPDEHSNDSNRLSIKGFSFGHSLTSENLDNFIGGDGWTPLTSSVQSMKQIQKSSKITPYNKTTSFDSVLQGGCSQKPSNLRFYQPDTNEEVLTLVQVLPNETRRQSPPKIRDRAGSLVSPLTSEKRNKFNTKRSCLNKSYSTSSGKCRWSMGPDGNIWILQLPENISSPMENWYDHRQSIKLPMYSKSESISHKPSTNVSTSYFNTAVRPTNLSIIKPFSSETDDTYSDKSTRQGSVDNNSFQPLWQYQEGYSQKSQGNGKVDISNMFETYETSPSRNVRKQGGINPKDPRHHTRPPNHDGMTRILQPMDQSLKTTSHANGSIVSGSGVKRKNDTHCCFHDADRSLKSTKKQPFLNSPNASLQKLIHVTSV